MERFREEIVRACLFGLLLALLAPMGLNALPVGANFDLTGATLHVRLHPELATMDVKAILRGRMIGCGDNLAFRLDRRFAVQWIRTPSGEPLEYRHVDEDLVVQLPGAHPAGSRWSLVVQYHGHLRNALRHPPLVEYLDAKGCYLRSTTAWYPRGRPFDSGQVELKVAMPRDWEALSAGRVRTRHQMTKGRLWSWVRRWPTRGVGLVAGPYREALHTPPSGEGVLRVLRYPRPGEGAPELELLTKLQAFYGRLFGSAPEPGFAVVEVDGLQRGSDGFDAFAEDGYVAVARPPEDMKGPYLEFLATCLARRWWGGKLRFATLIGDALASYSGLLALRKFDGREAFLLSAQERLQRYRLFARCASSPVVIKGQGENVPPQIYETVAHDKMPIVLIALEQRLGLKPFVRCLRAFASEFDGRVAGLLDFVESVERHGEVDLDDWVRRWLETPALPTGLPDDFQP